MAASAVGTKAELSVDKSMNGCAHCSQYSTRCTKKGLVARIEKFENISMRKPMSVDIGVINNLGFMPRLMHRIVS
jgi:hypothetical protein